MANCQSSEVRLDAPLQCGIGANRGTIHALKFTGPRRKLAKAMDDGFRKAFYSGTNVEIAAGDLITLDGHHGSIHLVFQPFTEDARNYSCYETGGVCFKLDQFGLIVESLDKLSDVTLVLRKQSN